MVAIFTGSGVGLERGSGNVLGGSGLLGSAGLGRGGEQLFLNAANGNLVIRHRDEFLTGRGDDIAVDRTYNSLGNLSDENADNWRQSTDRRVFGFSGTVSAWGSSVKRRSADGSEISYSWNGTVYAATDGDGAYDTLSYTGGGWVWTDGATGAIETYESRGGADWLIIQQRDTSGNIVAFSYSGEKLTQLATADGGTIQYTWSGNNITGIVAASQGTTLTRTRYAYDGYGRLASVTVDLSPEDGSIADGKVYTTSYTYHGTSKLVASISESDGASVSIAYDSLNRATSFTQTVAGGVSRTTTLGYGDGYTTITDHAGQVTRLDYAPGNLSPEISTWTATNLARATTMIDGRAGTQMTIQNTGYASTLYPLPVQAGDTVTFGVTLQAVGSYTAHSLGLYTTTANWGAANISSARIVSGPGVITQTIGGLWTVSGLSTTTGTRIEITRTYTEAATAQAAIYPDAPGNGRGGAGLVVANATLLKSATATDQSQMNIGNWGTGGVSVQAAGTMDGSPAYQYTVQQAGQWSGVTAGLAAKTGDTFSVSLSLKAVGDSTSHAFGLYGNISGWGANGNAYARIVSGPGTIVQGTGGLFTVQGLSTTAVTRVEIVRTYDRDEFGGAYFYPDHTAGWRAGAAVIASAPLLTRRLTESASAGQLLKITAPAAYAGAAQQVVEFGYDAQGNLASVKDAAGNTTRYTHDAAGNVLTITDRLGNTTSRTYNAANQILTEARTGPEDATSIPAAIVNGPNATAVLQPDGSYRITKSGGVNNSYDASARSSQPLTGDFVLRLRPLQSDKYFMAGVSQAPDASNDYTNLAFGVETASNGYLYFVQGSAYGQLVPYQVGDTVWLTREGSTINYYKGATLEAAKQAGAIRTVSGVSGTYYFDTALYSVGAAADVSITPMPRQTSRYVYDSLNRLRFLVSAAGDVTEYRYYGNGQLYLTLQYRQTYDVSNLGSGTALSEAQLQAWSSGIADPTALSTVEYRYDGRGNLNQRVSYGGWDTGYTHEYFGYDQAGQLLASVKDGQNQTSYIYDGLGRVTASTDVNGGTTSFVFNDAATQTVVTLASGLVQTSTYNKAGELISFTESGSGVAGGTASYQYDSVGRLRVMTDASGLKTYYVYDKAGRKVAEAHGSGTFTEYRYDTNDRVVATVRYGLGNSGAQVSLLQDPNSTATIDSLRPVAHPYDLWTWTVYDKEGRVVETIEGDGSVTAYEHDASGRLVKTVGYSNKLSAAQVEAFKSVSPATLVLPGADAKDSVARLFYDKDGRTIGVLDGAGYLSRTIYDGAGQKVQEIAYANPTNAAYRASGTLQNLIDTTAVSANDRSTRYVYDQQGYLRFTIDTLGHVTEYRYEYADWMWSAFGPVRQTIQYAGTIGALSSYTYESVKSAVGGLASDPANRTSWAVYDAAGRLAYSIDATGAVIGYSYDNRGQMTRKVEYATLRATSSLPSKADMDSWAGTPTASDRITRYYYNARGELRFTVDAEGYVTRTDYDAEGRAAYSARWNSPVTATDSSTLSSVAASVTGDYAATSRTYDDAGRLFTTTDPEGTLRRYYYYGNGKLAHEYVAPGEADQSRTTFTYDQAGRLAVRYDAYTAAEQAITQYFYDGLGNLVSTIDANSHATSWTYDKLGRKLSETNSAGGVTAFEYDAFGDLVRTIDARGNSTWSYYDKLGRVVATRDAEDYVTESAYTAFGELASVTRRANKAINGASASTLPVYPLNAKDAVTQFTYDKLGRVLTTTDAEGGVDTSWYDAFGGVIKTQNKLGGITEYNRNLRGLVIRELVHAPIYDATGNQTAPTYYRNKFEYDARGNLVHQIEAHGLPEQRDTFFYYDKADRLILKESTAVAVGQAGTMVTPYERYKYDKRGNLIETWDAAGGHAYYYYDDLDRKVAEIVAVSATTGAYKAYGYDGVGNLTSSKAYSGWAALPSSAGGTPPAPPAGEYRETSYTYDNVNRLLTSSIAGQAIGYWQSGSYVYTTGALTTSYQYDAVGNVVKATDPAGAVTYSYYDKLGRKTAQVDALSYATTWARDAEGNVTSERRYATQASGIGIGGYSASTSASDRVTEFEYDEMGRRLKEKRLGVEAWSLDTSTGQLASATGTSIVQYSYNALGQVTLKTEATGEATSYSYDSAGRLTAEHRAGFVDFQGSTVTPSVRYYYNSLDGLVRTEQGGSAASSADRVTMNLYGAGGRLLSTTDAAGNVRSYVYDAAGRKAGEYYTRDLGRDLVATGGLVTEGLGFEYDRAGNLTRQSVNTIASGAWTARSYVESAYNGFGELIQRRTDGDAGPSDSPWQEQFAYDGAGRLIRSNSGDGIWRHYVYDAAGRQTLAIESEGMDLSGMSQATAVSWASSDGVNATVTRYDARGQALEITQRLRETGVGSARQDIVIDRDYNAFGEMVREEDAYNQRTDYSYNSMGRVTQIQRPTVTVTAENGTQSRIRPTEKFFYDISGRLIGTQDANSVAAGASYKTTRQLLAGTGYGDGEAIVVKEWHPDGGTPVNRYDVFGDLRTATDEVNRTTWMSYDKLGRLVQQTDPASRTQYYAYDLLGNRTGHWNNVVGYAARERTEYDALGRVTLQVGYGDDTVGRDTIATSYVWEAGMVTSGMGASGGWLATTTYVNGLYGQERTDMFGRETWKRDLGGHVTATAYDLAGRIASKTVSDPASGTSDTVSYTWLNTGQVGQVTIGVDTSASQGNFTQDRTSYTYDLNGNRLTEIFTRRTGAMVDYGHWEYDYTYGYQDQYWVSDWQYETSLVTISSQSASYDELGRLTYWSAAATGTMPAASTNYHYDANSNIRRSVASFGWLDQNGTAYGSGTQDYWYRYDSMNRVVTAKGIQTGSGIVRGGQGVDLHYDAAGQRTQALSTTTAWGQVQVEVERPNGNLGWEYQDVYYEAENREDYTYWGDGQLKDVRIARSGYYDNGDGTITVTAPAATGLRKADYWYDTQGRLERQIDWGGIDPDVYGNGAVGSALYDRSLTYNAKGQVTFERLFQRQGGITQTNDTTSLYGSGSGYALGAVVSVTTQAWRSDVPYSTSTTSNTYKWYDGAALASTTVTGTTSGTTTYNYNGFGQLVSAWISDGRSRSVSFLNDANGQAIRRDEQDYVGQGDPHEVWYRFAGREMGYTGNNGTLETDYTSSVASRPLTPGNGAFRGGATYGAIHADFDQFYNPVTSYEQGGAGGSYTVQGGETLSSIAAQLWGDSNLWYRLAEANGLSAGSALAEGQRLTIPAGVMRSSYNASTFAPYDPGAALGDTSPTTPTPQAPRKAKGNKCGVFGAILMVAVAVAVVAILKVPVTNLIAFGSTTAPAAGTAAVATVAGSAGAAAGAAGAAAAATVVGGTAATAGIAAGVAGGAIAGMAGSAVSQLFGMATGIQQGGFNWKGVALAGISGGVTGGLSQFSALSEAGKITGTLGKIGRFLGTAGAPGGAASGLVGNALSQGVGRLTGLQRRFDFTGLAVAGVIGAASGAMGAALASEGGLFGIHAGLGSTGNAMLSGAAGALAGAASRSLLEGTDFGDNLMAALPDVIGSTIGSLMAKGVASIGRQKPHGAPTNLLPEGVYEASPDPVVAHGPAAVDTAPASAPTADQTSGQGYDGAQPDDIVVTAASLLDAVYWRGDVSLQIIGVNAGEDPGPLANGDDKRFGNPFRMQSGRTFLFGGAGNDPNLAYLPKWKTAFEAAGIGGIEIPRGDFSYGNIVGSPWGMVIDAANVIEFNHMFDESYYNFGDWSALNSYTGQINLVGYSYGAIIAAQKSLTIAYSGARVDNVVLIGAPINQDLLNGLTSHPNIGRVTVINLSEYGDPIYAGMSDVAITSSAFKLGYQMTQGTGHFIYGQKGVVADQRRATLGRILYQNGVR